MKIKRTAVLLGSFVIMIVLVFAVSAESMVGARTGDLKLTKPDGTILTVGKGDPFPKVPSGSVIEVLTGRAHIAPKKGFFQLVVGSSVVTVGEGDVVEVFVDPRTGVVTFYVSRGMIKVISGNTVTTLRAGQSGKIGFDEKTGTVEVTSIKGVIETVTAGVKVSVPEGAEVKITADATTRNVHVESVTGTVRVTSVSGEIVDVPSGKTIDTPASAVGEIQTFEAEAEADISLTEEPAEPERPEASEYR